MTRHYPLDQELDFERFQHRPLGVPDVMINRIWETYVSPWELGTDLLKPPIDPRTVDDLQCLIRMAITLWDTSALSAQLSWAPLSGESSHLAICAIQRGLPRWNLEHTTLSRKDQARVQDLTFDIVQRYFFEIFESSTALFLKHLKHHHTPLATPMGVMADWHDWPRNLSDHLKSYRKNSQMQKHYFIFSGSSRKPKNESHFTATGFILSLPQPQLFRHFEAVGGDITSPMENVSTFNFGLHDMRCLSHEGRAKTKSVPPPGSWATAGFWPPDTYHKIIKGENTQRIIYFPARRISELDRLVRRRSLSRTHIRNMFKDPPRGSFTKESSCQSSKQAQPCTNCGAYIHTSKKCPSPCGYCGKVTHQAPKCPVKRSNRCKCRPFPGHVAASCPQRCSRRCGNQHVPSHNKHVNAMTCRFRCCMCGIHGHSGKECRFQRCQCGLQHLTQDCRWKVECPANGCDRYLCRLHCVECGKKRPKEVQFTGGRCQTCLTNECPIRPRLEG